VIPMLGANLGAIRRLSLQTVMDAPGHIHSDDRARRAERAHLIRQGSIAPDVGSPTVRLLRWTWAGEYA
jgi:hypothetical protein